MSKLYDYTTKLNVKYKHFELIDISKIVEETKDKWFNQTLTEVNGSVVRVGIVEGEYHWHKHENDDEFFFVLKGKLFVDFRESVPSGEGSTIELNPGQGVTISKNVIHKTRSPQKTVMLMVENKGINPTGD
ncbi:MAG: cupin domain-containing protein [Ignavibacteriaceae bacterium]